MSLINDALKKAQKQRTGEVLPLASMPAIGGESAARIAKRAKPAGFNALLLRLGLGAGGLLVLVVGGCILLRVAKKPAAAPTGAALSAIGSPPAAPGVHPLAPVAEPPATSAATTFNLPIAAPVVTAAPVTPPPAVVAKAPVPAPAVANPAVSEPKPLPSPPPPPAKMDNKAINFIENLRIAGIRASTTDSKVLMNDRVYRNGDIVEHEMGLKLVGITSSSLTFEDEHGARYTRTF